MQVGRRRWALRADLGQALNGLSGPVPDQETIQRQLAARGWSEERSRRTAEVLMEMLGSQDRSCRGRQPLWLRMPLCPTGWTQACARKVEFLTDWPALLVGATAGLGGLLWALLSDRRQVPLEGPAILLGITGFFLTALWHELGHAAALRRGGYPGGGIGLGVLFIIPVLFADVSAVALLPRNDRLRVDLAGVVFQLAAAGLLAAAGCWWSHPVLGPAGNLAAWLALTAGIWSLLPFIRADGYWFLCDLLKLEDLDRPVPRHRSRWMRGFLIAHRLANALFLMAVGVALPLKLHGLLVMLTGWIGWSGYPATGLTVVFAAVAWWGLMRRLLLLSSSCRIDLLRLLGSRV